MLFRSSLKPSPRYTGVAIALHWLLGLMIVGAFAMGLYMHELPVSPTRHKLFNWHKWAGITILVLSVLRLLWRVTHRPPADLPAPRWQNLAAHGTHWALYALFFLVPLAGWAYSSAAGFQVVWFGVLPLPDFVGKDKALAEEQRRQQHGPDRHRETQRRGAARGQFLHAKDREKVPAEDVGQRQPHHRPEGVARQPHRHAAQPVPPQQHQGAAAHGDGAEIQRAQLAQRKFHQRPVQAPDQRQGHQRDELRAAGDQTATGALMAGCGS